MDGTAGRAGCCSSLWSSQPTCNTVLFVYSHCSYSTSTNILSIVFFDNMEQRNKILNILLAADERNFGPVWSGNTIACTFPEVGPGRLQPSIFSVVFFIWLSDIAFLGLGWVAMPCPRTKMACHFWVLIVSRHFVTLIPIIFVNPLQETRWAWSFRHEDCNVNHVASKWRQTLPCLQFYHYHICCTPMRMI